MLNKVMLIGHLTRQPVGRKTASGRSITTFTVATNHHYRLPATKEVREAVEFHPVVAWGRLAEIVEQYLDKGSRVYLEGRLMTQTTTRQGRVQSAKTVVMAREMLMLGDGRKKPVPEIREQEDVAVEEVPIDEEE